MEGVYREKLSQTGCMLQTILYKGVFSSQRRIYCTIPEGTREKYRLSRIGTSQVYKGVVDLCIGTLYYMYEVCSKLYRNDAISRKVHIVARLREDKKNLEAVMCKSTLQLHLPPPTGLVRTAGASGATLRHRPRHTHIGNQGSSHTHSMTRAYVAADRRVTVRKLASNHGLSIGTIDRILHKELRLVKKSAKAEKGVGRHHAGSW
jgi:hypothetical protein